MGIHYFLAVRIPVRQSEAIHHFIRGKDRLSFKRWVHPLDYHITLAFLGEPPEDSHLIHLMGALADKIEGKFPPFSLEFESIHTFGHQDSPRILWLGVQASDALADLREQIYSQCIKNGFKLDSKPFVPHITLARKWDSKAPYTGVQAGDGLKIPPFEAASFELLQTHPERTPKYETVRSFQLMKAGSK
ncbi:RNA 2',3'-cyclic phosphodiesterase [Bacillus sp. FJAT-42376]|uniref:RNA 2',3'-cyclic phosphodiesterase n=1 Tax=Bacillus sp. FJAT-42376 TaxID=2014076 RepID=UPI000F4E6FFD|nr:RNA 2',3'-cyclic phosphodiesterase [Bacillus sp. FJAT-42376]AZB43993.1 RNA 2',3'-cyclic phosphodiesterase [Bacillus sp. FJAT-42376]